jgi:hypothetical protein
VLVLTAGMVAAAGCSGAAESATEVAGEPTIGDIPVLLSTEGLSLPIDDYSLTSDQMLLLDRARLVLIDRCMNRFGIRYVVEGLPQHDDFSAGTVDRRYGVTDRAAAAGHGYGLDAVAPPRPVSPALTPEGETALWGEGSSKVLGVDVPAGGCVGEANRELEASAPATADVNLGQRLSMASFEASQDDSRVVAATRAWSDCMSAHGYDYDEPLAPLADPRFGATGTEGTAREVAVQDVDCKEEVNLVGIWFSVESAYQRRMMEEQASALALTAEAIRAQIEVAEATLAAAGQD